MTTLTVGTGQEYTTLSAAVAAASTGDTIDLQAGTYTNDFPALINGLTIEGVGGIAKLVATAQPGNGKAILDVAGNTTLENLDISNVTVPDTNGAAIRYESGNLVIENTAIHGNQDGILGASDPNGTITIDKSEIYRNGTDAGNTHNLYIGDIATFTLTNSYIHDANTGHEVKSRAENNIITNNRIEDNSSTSSYEIDLPNGGNATISGNTIQKSASSGNRVTIAYGEEGSTHAGTTVSVTNNTFINDQSGAYVLWDTTGAPITASGNQTYNYSQIDKSGYVSSSGFTAIGSRPTLDTSSPIDLTGGSSTSTPTLIPAAMPTLIPAATPTLIPDVTPQADTAAPSVTATESVSGSTTQTSAVISGTVSDSGSGVAAVEVFVSTAGKSTDLGNAALSGTTWSDTVSNLAPATYTFSAVAFDNAGNTTAPISAGPAVTVTATSAQPVTPSGVTATSAEPGTPSRVTATSAQPGTPSTPSRPTVASLSSSDSSVVLTGTADANSRVTLIDTSNGKTSTIGTVTAASDGSWSISSATTNTSAVNAFAAISTTGWTATGSAGLLFLSSARADTFFGTPGRADVFAFTANLGQDVINGFQTTAAAGVNHDVIDLSSTAYHSFDQLKPALSGSSATLISLDAADTINLTGISSQTLQASDFRFT